MLETKGLPQSDGLFVEAFARGLAVIKVFGRGREELTLSEVAESAGVSPAGARRLLHTLVALGYARHQKRRFSLTPAILDIGYAYLGSLTLREVAIAYLEQFAKQYQEICSLSVLDRTDIVFVARAEISSPSARRIITGERLPAHATSTGHVLLAYAGEDELARYFQHAPFEKLTDNTLTEERQLRGALADARQRGYSLACEEFELGVCGLAVPVVNREEKVVAALTTSLNMAKYKNVDVVQLFLPRLQALAAEIGNGLAV
ncbi:IclR family transcriptional regulator domain-containing protein [Candidimonas nitroreducens]|uniref:IclR family transcriptional regulator n=1 Tax=Candidimonas nitroreducens TaxID=683354 RepID=A0A225M640_9BURK|nr:IclR family transcriptional regulator C-terminal domain-containing protein [Candidimonas nitroreducens]OWT56787.1 IclR family transcriptional regulator [Candidimonas nitroreducens]